MSRPTFLGGGVVTKMMFCEMQKREKPSQNEKIYLTYYCLDYLDSIKKGRKIRKGKNQTKKSKDIAVAKLHTNTT